MSTLTEQLVRESTAMARRLTSTGSSVPAPLIRSADAFQAALERQEPVDVAALAGTHQRLAALVAPSRPGTLYLLGRSGRPAERKDVLPDVQMGAMVKAAIVCMTMFIVLSLVQLVDAHPQVELFAGERMLVLKVMLEQVFSLSAAGIGAAFAVLFQVNERVQTRTWDPGETVSYWLKFFLGLVAGFVLASLVPKDGTLDSGAEALGAPVLALLGGFSASAVYRILTRSVEAVESVFTGGVKTPVAAATRSAAARAAAESTEARMAMAARILDLQQRMAAGLSAAETAAHLRQMIAALAPSAVDEGLRERNGDAHADASTSHVSA
jgi:hypothetical protein